MCAISLTHACFEWSPARAAGAAQVSRIERGARAQRSRGTQALEMPQLRRVESPGVPTVASDEAYGAIGSRVVETRTVEVAPRTIGRGADPKVVVPGVEGVERVTIDGLSGQVLASETLVEARPAVCRMVPPAGTPVVALTFDDGPWPGQTRAVLDVLEERDVPATFFMLGFRVSKNPDLARAVAESGHAIGNHTYNHIYLDSATPEVTVREIQATNQIIQKVTGVRPTWFRAPGGVLNGQVLKYIGRTKMRSALWTVDPQDWRDAMTPGELTACVVSGVRPGAIIVLHDGGGDQSATVTALPVIIDKLRAAGYEFVTLDELSAVKATW